MAVAASPAPRSPSPADSSKAKDGAEFAYEYVPVAQAPRGGVVWTTLMYALLPLYYPPNQPTHKLVFIPHSPSRRSHRPEPPLRRSAPPPHTLPSTISSPPVHVLPPAPAPTLAPAKLSPRPHVKLAMPPPHAVTAAPLPPIASPARTLHQPASTLLARPCTIATDHACILRTYEMTMRQQPVQARMCGVGEKSDRRPVDPAPIIQLRVIDKNGEDVTGVNPSVRDGDKEAIRRPEPGPNGMTFMQNPYYFLFACLVGDSTSDDELHVIDDGKTRFLTGTPVSSLYHLKDLDKTDAAFFVFPDLGVRKEGKYRLKLTLFEIVDQEVYYCTTTFTSVFSVYSAKKFPGMSHGASELSKSFADQGLKIRVRKEARKRTSKNKRKSTTESSEDDARPKRLSRGPSHPGHPSTDPRYSYPFYPSQSGYPMPPPPPPAGYERDPRDPRETRGRAGPPPSAYHFAQRGAYPPQQQPHPTRHHGSLPPSHMLEQQPYAHAPSPSNPPAGYYDRPMSNVPWPQPQSAPVQDRALRDAPRDRQQDRDRPNSASLPSLSQMNLPSLTSTPSTSGLSGEQQRGGTSHSHASSAGSGGSGSRGGSPAGRRNHRMGLGHLVD